MAIGSWVNTSTLAFLLSLICAGDRVILVPSEREGRVGGVRLGLLNVATSRINITKNKFKKRIHVSKCKTTTTTTPKTCSHLMSPTSLNPLSLTLGSLHNNVSHNYASLILCRSGYTKAWWTGLPHRELRQRVGIQSKQQWQWTPYRWVCHIFFFR